MPLRLKISASGSTQAILQREFADAAEAYAAAVHHKRGATRNGHQGTSHDEEIAHALERRERAKDALMRHLISTTP
jgi:hypothetical protein